MPGQNQIKQDELKNKSHPAHARRVKKTKRRLNEAPRNLKAKAKNSVVTVKVKEATEITSGMARRLKALT